MTARDVIDAGISGMPIQGMRWIDADMPLVDVLPRLLDAPGRMLGVRDGDRILGEISGSSLLDGLGRMIAPRDDCSVVVMECRPEDYSASVIARSVEDTGSHLVDLWSAPGEGGMLRVTLRIRTIDPSSVVRGLERHGFAIEEAGGANYRDRDIAVERLMSLQSLLNV